MLGMVMSVDTNFSHRFGQKRAKSFLKVMAATSLMFRSTEGFEKTSCG